MTTKKNIKGGEISPVTASFLKYSCAYTKAGEIHFRRIIKLLIGVHMTVDFASAPTRLMVTFRLMARPARELNYSFFVKTK